MADRMRRLWMPFRTGDNALAVGADARVTMETLIETTQGRRLRQYTVTRMLINMSFDIDAASTGMFSVGMRFENENVALGVVTPVGDLTAEWLYWEEIKPFFGVNQNNQTNRVVRDIRTQRKSHGNDQDLLFYISNDTGVAGGFNMSGRILVLIA